MHEDSGSVNLSIRSFYLRNLDEEVMDVVYSSNIESHDSYRLVHDKLFAEREIGDDHRSLSMMVRSAEVTTVAA